MRLLTLMMLMILGAVAVRTQAPNPYRTNGLSNGVLWRGANPSQRVSYVDGASDGFVRGIFWELDAQHKGPSLTSPTPKWLRANQGTTVGDIVKEMDAFYEEGSNISLPMIVAFEYSEMKLGGSTQAELDSFLKAAR